ncbi:MAG: S41 family peptidase [Candidatus Sungiibacteriota bacterium]|uniref:S41 family peptidase n=1 Tax=Candidatus Sungiibacteriota bacterium TaxID=2750080 RepID=A0A7T5US42_9BACT|nr:MAG: S41 family peptidase [Candidatus Sungbacteria bacterium]
MSQFDWKKYIKVYNVLIAVVILGLAFGGGVYYGYQNRPAVEKVLNVVGQTPPPQFQDVDFNLFWDVWSRLEDKFVDRAKINRQDLVYGAISGLVKALKDPHSEFLPPAQTKQFQEDIKGSFDGIGAEIGIRKSVLTVVAPLKGMPAEKAGLRAADKILKIDDTLTADLTLDEAVRLIRGPKGTEVKLLILRDSFEQPKEFKITRDTIRVQIVETERKPDGIFVIKLNHFTEGAAFEFRKAVKEFYETDSKKLVLDLRNNPGGFLAVSIDIASWFVPAGEVVARERFADGSEEIYRSTGYRLFEKVPMAVLVNEGSASASEIVAGAVRDIRGVKLVGTKTFGKGSVQEILSLPGKSSLKITIAKWLTPKGEEINGTGLEPDIKVELPKDRELKEGEDPIMEKGIEVLKGL